MQTFLFQPYLFDVIFPRNDNGIGPEVKPAQQNQKIFKLSL